MTKHLTTATGAPIADNQNSLTAGQRGPIVLQDFHLLEKIAHFNRERIPERVVHAKGLGRIRLLRVTARHQQWTTAQVFGGSARRRRCSPAFRPSAAKPGAADTERDPRGFALKFYTEEGNWDLVGNNTPVFFIRDPLKFPDFIHTQKRHPATQPPSTDAMWDFWSLSPESLHQVTILISDRGTPDRRPPHERLRQPHLQPHQPARRAVLGEVSLQDRNKATSIGPTKRREKVVGNNPESTQQDLFGAIERGDFPKWRSGTDHARNRR